MPDYLVEGYQDIRKVQFAVCRVQRLLPAKLLKFFFGANELHGTVI